MTEPVRLDNVEVVVIGGDDDVELLVAVEFFHGQADRAFNGVTHADILAILNRYGAIEAAHARAAQYAEAARKAICTFPDSEIKRALLWAPEFVIAREK
jgi:geranylgeranyl pyrophosphate synthase